MKKNKIVPCIWFNNTNVTDIIDYYQNIFGENFKFNDVIPLGDTPDGYGEMCEVEIFEQKYTLMSTANAHHSLNDAISFIISCVDQNEIDKYWNYFTKDGEESQCGWCIDKFGLRFQIVPENLEDLMTSPKAWEVLMGQQKIVISEFL